MRYKPTSPMALLACLQALYPDSSKTRLRELIRDGKVWVEGSLARIPSRIVPAGATVDLRREAHAARDLPCGRVLHEDDHLVVLEKKEKYLSVATHKENRQTAYAHLLTYVRRRNPRASLYVVHRLDYGTSGLLMFAKTRMAQDKVKDQFASRDLQREYLAVVEGTPRAKHGTLEHWLAESQTLRVHVTRDKRKGRRAVCRYALRQGNKRYSLLDVFLETGRRGQIRAQLAEIGHPIAGDHDHGANTDPIDRLCLHAHRLALRHPATQEDITFTSPMPAAFQSIVGEVA